MLTRNKKLFFCILIALIISSAFSVLFYTSVFSKWQHKLADTLYSEQKPLDNIVIIAIDDKSLQEIGRWPWSRNNFTQLIPLISDAAVIGIDVAFFEPSDPIEDKLLANATKKAGNIVYPVEYMSFNEEGKGGDILKPIPALREAALRLGHINILTDDDGITRSAILKIHGNESYESFSLQILKSYLGIEDFQINTNKLLINFIGKPGTFTTLSFSDVLNKKVNVDFKDKIVLIGATSPDLHDDAFVPTSMGKAMPGVEIHANIIQTLLTKKFLVNQTDLSVILTIFIIGLITSLILYGFRIFKATVITILLIFVYLIITIFAFKKGLIMNIIYPPINVIFIYTGIAVMNYLTEEKSKKRVMSVFGKYVSENVAKEILSKEKIELKGIKRQITTLFADIRGFTALSEKLPPEKVVKMLNLYLGKMTEAVFEYNGTLDKYMGDAIMAIFGAPLKQKNHALNAIKAALEMQKIATSLKQNVKFGIGINSGYAVIGNIGSEKRMEYTAIGDSVNTAARLCSIAKGGQVLISEDTYKLVKKNVNVKKLGKVKVKGKKKAIVIYEVKRVL